MSPAQFETSGSTRPMTTALLFFGNFLPPAFPQSHNRRCLPICWEAYSQVTREGQQVLTEGTTDSACAARRGDCHLLFRSSPSPSRCWIAAARGLLCDARRQTRASCLFSLAPVPPPPSASRPPFWTRGRLPPSAGTTTPREAGGGWWWAAVWGCTCWTMAYS